MTIDELKAEALRLNPEERAELASELLVSLDNLSEAEVGKLWIDEAVRREAELDSGTARAIPAAEVFAAARARLRWGTSLAVRIPESFAEELGLRDDSAVEMRLVDGGLLVQPMELWAPTLDELLDAVTDANLRREMDSGPAQGAEAW